MKTLFGSLSLSLMIVAQAGNLYVANDSNSGTLNLNSMGTASRASTKHISSLLNINCCTAQILQFGAVTGVNNANFYGPIPLSDVLNRPFGLAFGPDGNLYVANRAGNNILKYEGSTGNFLGVFICNLYDPIDLTFGPDGSLYVSEFFNNDWLKFNGTTGAPIPGFVPPYICNPWGIRVGPDGNVYVASYGDSKIYKFDAAGNSLATNGFPVCVPYPSGITFDRDGNLWASLYFAGQVQKVITATGALSTITAAPGTPAANDLTNPIGVTFGPQVVFSPANTTVTGATDVLYVASYSTNEVLKYDSNTGAFLGAFVPVIEGSGGLCQPTGLVFGPDMPGPGDNWFVIFFAFN